VLTIRAKMGFGSSTVRRLFLAEQMRIRTEVSRKNWAWVFGVTLLTFASLLGLQLAKAQTATGTIVGTVTDPKGLSIVEVNVVVRNQDTETETIFSTNARTRSGRSVPGRACTHRRHPRRHIAPFVGGRSRHDAGFC